MLETGARTSPLFEVKPPLELGNVVVLDVIGVAPLAGLLGSPGSRRGLLERGRWLEFNEAEDRLPSLAVTSCVGSVIDVVAIALLSVFLRPFVSVDLALVVPLRAVEACSPKSPRLPVSSIWLAHEEHREANK